ncbi:unnamed protein product [Parascedosporium putredinis]|uniref:Uncharacterized protein n=1 Tax=Parascedosporium putredinis TaxID=1442378 RepID=A0A9P1H6T0_9PEZI|nr:unnamed protein product [Parascedosporium putredinis]CAI7997952.1 unnamed protein product [Parascedosporium putredinis]
MPTAPTSELSQLSLDSSMPPLLAGAPGRTRGQIREDVSSSEDDTDSHGSATAGDSDEDEDSSLVRSPTRLTYHLGGLPRSIQGAARDAFQDPPKITLQCCRLKDGVYAFQMTELLAKQTLYNRNSNTPLSLTVHGYPAEVGHPFTDISNFHLDLLAESLHCDLVDPECDRDGDLDESQKFRPDIFTAPHRGKKPLKRGDLEQTLFRMLLDNKQLFNELYSLTRYTDPIKDPFRRLSQRAARVFAELDTYCSELHNASVSGPRSLSPSSSSSVSPAGSLAPRTETPCNVSWAAHHILGIVSSIRAAVYPLHASTPFQRIGAARALVRILSGVSDRNGDVNPGSVPAERNLYARLIGTSDEDFVIAILVDIPEASSHFLHNLEVVQDRLKVHGAPPSYIGKFSNLISTLRGYPQPGSSRSSPVGQVLKDIVRDHPHLEMLSESNKLNKPGSGRALIPS